MELKKSFLLLFGAKNEHTQAFYFILFFTHRHFNYLHQTGYLSQGLQTQMPTGSRPETLPGEAGKLGEDNRDWWGLRQTEGLTVLSQSGVAASGSSHCSLRGNASPRSPYSLIV